MSYITEIVLIDVDLQDVVRINEWLSEHDQVRHPGFPQSIRAFNIEAVAGGGKVFCSKLAAGAFNYLPGGFLGMLKDGSQWISTCMWTYSAEGDHEVCGMVDWGEGQGKRTVQWVERSDY